VEGFGAGDGGDGGDRGERRRQSGTDLGERPDLQRQAPPISRFEAARGARRQPLSRRGPYLPRQSRPFSLIDIAPQLETPRISPIHATGGGAPASVSPFGTISSPASTRQRLHP
jgi:hypothetical protein